MSSLELALVFASKANAVYARYSKRAAECGALDGRASVLWGKFERYVEAARYLQSRDTRNL